MREAINSENSDRMKSLSNDLQQALMQIGSAVYAQAGAGTQGTQDTPGKSGGSNEDVIDADFV